MSGVAAATRQRLQQLLRHFPPVAHAFAYGSGVMHQPGLYPDVATPNPGLGPGGAAPASSTTSPSPNTDPARHPSTTTDVAANTSPAKGKGPMLDLVFAVPNARAWHRANIAQNPEHYAWLTRSVRYGPELVTGIAEVVGVGVHFNTLVPLNGTLIKYGVMEAAPLVSELSGWRQLFLAGRLHKPVLTLQSSDDVEAAQAHNLRSALAVALLQLPGSFTTEALLQQVCGLSYSGDVRMGLAEDPHKVARIVEGSRQGLELMYLPLLRGIGTSGTNEGSSSSGNGGSQGASGATADMQQAPLPTAADSSAHGTSIRTAGSQGGPAQAVAEALPAVSTAVSGDRWQQDMSYGGRLALLRALPVGLLHEVSRRLGLLVPESHMQIPETLGEITARVMLQERADHPLYYRNLVTSSLTSIVRRSSAAQAVSGALAAGGGKSYEYLAQKLRKAAWVRQLPAYLGLNKAGPAARGLGK